MREIKFRIFDKKIKKYIYSDEFESGGIKTLNLYFFFKFIEDMRDCDNKFGELEQCTGLKDKNSDDIYELDIVKYPTGFKELVDFHDGAFNIHWCYGNCEIIGNIRENTELLENK